MSVAPNRGRHVIKSSYNSKSSTNFGNQPQIQKKTTSTVKHTKCQSNSNDLFLWFKYNWFILTSYFTVRKFYRGRWVWGEVAFVHISSHRYYYKAFVSTDITNCLEQRIRIFGPMVHIPLYSYSIHSLCDDSHTHMLRKEKHWMPVFTPSASFNYDTGRKDRKHTIVPDTTNAVAEARWCTNSIME